MVASSSMFLTHLTDKRKRNEEGLCNDPEAIGSPQKRVLSQLCKSLDQDSSSFQKYLLAYMLLVKNGNLIEVRRIMSEKENMLNLILFQSKKRKHAIEAKPENDNGKQRSDDCLIPGLHDDIALDCLAWACRSDIFSLACLNKKFNLLICSGYLYKLRAELGIVEHWVYLACSLMPWEAFDPSTRRWMRLPQIPCDDCFSSADKESLAVGTQLLVFGLEVSGFAIWMYTLERHHWSRCPLMKLPRCLFASGSNGEVAIIAGGIDRNGQVLSCVELYNSDLGSWETLPDMHLPRKMCSGFFMDKKFYVIGGMASHTIPLTCGEEYNLETGTWRRIDNMYPGGNSAMQSPPLVAVVNNQLYAADQSTNVVKKYDKVHNSWNVIKALPVRADHNNGWGLAFKACGDKLLVIGGHRGPQGEVIMLHCWRPDEGSSANADWEVLYVKERAGAFVHNCAIMGC